MSSSDNQQQGGQSHLQKQDLATLVSAVSLGFGFLEEIFRLSGRFLMFEVR